MKNEKIKFRDRLKDISSGLGESLKESTLWGSIFRPGSPFRKGYSDSPRNRSYVVMNNVLYHLHPVKLKRHGVRLSYTLCLGGLSFFTFIVLTITGIWLMFYFRPTEMAYVDIQSLQTSIAFGSLVRNMHRWAAHIMVLVVFLHMSRVFYHGAYKAPREFNWVIGVILLLLTLLLSFTGYLLPWDQLAIWAVTVGGNMAGYTPVFGAQVLLPENSRWNTLLNSTGSSNWKWRARLDDIVSRCESSKSIRTPLAIHAMVTGSSRCC